MDLRRLERKHKPPSIPVDDVDETLQVRVIYGPCDRCPGERPFLVPADDPILPEHEYVCLIVALDEILEHCHILPKQ